MLIPEQEFASNTAVATKKGIILCSQQPTPDKPDEIRISADFLNVESVNWHTATLCSLLGQDTEEDPKKWYCSRESRTT